MRSIEFPAPSTDVPCIRFTIVLVPATRLLFVIESASPADVLAEVTAIKLQSPVVLVPTILTKSPVYPAPVVVCSTLSAVLVSCEPFVA